MFFDLADLKARYQHDLLGKRYLDDLGVATAKLNTDPQLVFDRSQVIIDHPGMTSDKYIPLKLAALSLSAESSFKLGHYLTQKELSDLGIKLASKIKSERFKAVFYALRGQSADLLGQTDIARNNFNKAARIANIIGDTDIKFNVYRMRGDLFSYQGDYQSALEDLQIAYSIYTNSNKAPKFANVLNNLANLYSYMGELQLALDTLTELLKIQRSTGDAYAIATTLYNIGKVEYDLSHTQNAMVAYNESLKISLELGDIAGIAYAKSGLGVLLKNEDAQQSLNYLTQSLKHFKSLNDREQIAQNEIFLADVYLKLGKTNKALESVESGLLILETLSAPLLARSGFRLKSEIFAAMGDYASAYTAYIDFKKVDDDIFNQERNRQINQLMVEFETEKKIKENQLLQKENELKQLTINKNQQQSKLQFGIISLFAILIIILAFSVSKLVVISKKLKTLAHTDELSGIPNRRAILQKCTDEIARCRRYHSPFSLIIFDIDNFKAINDNYGHQIGDIVIQRVSHSCRQLLRNEDAMGRIGGEEFLVILPHTSHEDAMITAERIRRKIEAINYSDIHQDLKVTISLGTASLKSNDSNMTDLTHRADMALYKAKERGRNRVETSEPELNAEILTSAVFKIA